MGHQRDYSEEIAGVVDEEVRKLIENAHDEAWHVVNDNRDVLDKLVLELLERETLNAAELAKIFEQVVKRPLRPTWLSSEARLLSDRPPVLTPAEQTAMSNGRGPQDASGNDDLGRKIDDAANAGAHPLAEEEGRTRVIEVPEGGHVDPSGDH